MAKITIKSKATAIVPTPIDNLLKGILNVDLSTMPLNDKVTLLEMLEKKKYIESRRKSSRMFNTPENRAAYHKHCDFFAAGATYRTRAFLAGNRCGKSEAGAFEVSCHATGIYPDWWTGRKFDEPVKIWVVGRTGETIRDTVQVALLGNPGQWGTGAIPGDKLDKITKNNSRADIVTVKHASGGLSYIGFKSNDAGRVSFEGTSQHVIWCDEEVDLPIYMECVTRTMTTDGIILTTFTPLKGLTDLILSLIKDGNLESPQSGVNITTCTWDDVPHLTTEAKAEMLALLPPHQRLARSAGIPQLGSGVVYPIDPESYKINPFEVPKHWLRINALDVGWKFTAAVFGAINPEDGMLYIYSEHYVSAEEPLIHAKSIKLRGDILTIIDSAAHGRSQVDGRNLFDMYQDHGLRLVNANKSVEAGIYAVWELFSAGRLKIFSNCLNTLSELKTYRRDEQGKIIKSNDHAMDSLRYLIMGRDDAHSLIPKVIDQGNYNTVSAQHRRLF